MILTSKTACRSCRFVRGPRPPVFPGYAGLFNYIGYCDLPSSVDGVHAVLLDGACNYYEEKTDDSERQNDSRPD